MNRTSAAQVISAYRYLVSTAKKKGVDTSKWNLQYGNSSYGYQWRILADSVVDLGTTKREAYQTLRAIEEAYRLIG